VPAVRLRRHPVVVDPEPQPLADARLDDGAVGEAVRGDREPPHLDDRVVRDEHPDRVPARRGLPRDIEARSREDRLELPVLVAEPLREARDDGVGSGGLAFRTVLDGRRRSVSGLRPLRRGAPPSPRPSRSSSQRGGPRAPRADRATRGHLPGDRLIVSVPRRPPTR
jgi:hypothetical protein